MKNKELGKLLQKARKLKCVSAEEAAHILKISPDTLKRYESGTIPSIERLIVMCKWYKIKPLKVLEHSEVFSNIESYTNDSLTSVLNSYSQSSQFHDLLMRTLMKMYGQKFGAIPHKDALIVFEFVVENKERFLDYNNCLRAGSKELISALLPAFLSDLVTWGQISSVEYFFIIKKIVTSSAKPCTAVREDVLDYIENLASKPDHFCRLIDICSKKKDAVRIDRILKKSAEILSEERNQE